MIFCFLPSCSSGSSLPLPAPPHPTPTRRTLRTLQPSPTLPRPTLGSPLPKAPPFLPGEGGGGRVSAWPRQGNLAKTNIRLRCPNSRWQDAGPFFYFSPSFIPFLFMYSSLLPLLTQKVVSNARKGPNPVLGLEDSSREKIVAAPRGVDGGKKNSLTEHGKNSYVHTRVNRSGDGCVRYQREAFPHRLLKFVQLSTHPRTRALTHVHCRSLDTALLQWTYHLLYCVNCLLMLLMIGLLQERRHSGLFCSLMWSWHTEQRSTHRRLLIDTY